MIQPCYDPANRKNDVFKADTNVMRTSMMDIFSEIILKGAIFSL